MLVRREAIHEIYRENDRQRREIVVLLNCCQRQTTIASEAPVLAHFSLSLCGVACLHRIGMNKMLERAAAHRYMNVGLTLRGSAAAEDHHPIAEEPE